MNVSIQLTQTARSSNAGKCTTLLDVDLDMALTISTALYEQPDAEFETMILVEESVLPPHKLLASHTDTFPSWAGWLRSVRPAPTPPTTLLH